MPLNTKLMKTVLIIEDNIEIKENTAEILELANFKVITATNGREGIEEAASKRPDVILCDILMPQMNGYDVIRCIRDNPLTSKIPFIYVTASTEKSEVKLAMDLGADGYVPKPFDDRELMKTIENVLQK